MKLNKNQNGFALVLEIAVIGTVLLVIGLVGFLTLRRNHKSAQSKPAAQTTKTAISATSPTTSPTTTATTSTNSGQTTTSKSSTSSPKTTTSGPTSSPAPNTQPAPTKPTITISAPTSGAVVFGTSVRFACTTTTPSGFSKIIMSNRDSSNQEEGAFTQDQDNACDMTLDFTYVPNGSYTAIFTVYDSAGNTAAASVSYTYQQ